MGENYYKLWDYLRTSCLSTETLTFDEIFRIAGIHVDSKFMNHTNELKKYGLSVVKINLNNKTVMFCRNGDEG